MELSVGLLIGFIVGFVVAIVGSTGVDQKRVDRRLFSHEGKVYKLVEIDPNKE